MVGSQVTIVLVTRNRCRLAVSAIESCLAQNYEPLEVLVYDDGSTDGTPEAVASRFPEVKLTTSSERKGYIVWRNCGLREAAGEYVFFLDDDSYFTSAETISRTLALFETQADVAAVALPYVESGADRRGGTMDVVGRGAQLRNYIGCAHALRRDVALRAGGYREFLIHQGEERDLCARLLQAGHRVVFGDSPPLVHLYSPDRDQQRADFYGVRNTILLTFLLVPLPYLLPRLMIDSVQLLAYRPRLTQIPHKLKALLCGYSACLRYYRDRQPLDLAVYRTYRSLPSHGPLRETAEPVPLTRSSGRKAMHG